MISYLLNLFLLFDLYFNRDWGDPLKPFYLQPSKGKR